MGYYKYYLRKLINFILRWFDKKTLILIILFLLFLCFNEGVFALEKSVYDMTFEEMLELTDEDLESLSEEEILYVLQTLDLEVSTYDFSSADSSTLNTIQAHLFSIDKHFRETVNPYIKDIDSYIRRIYSNLVDFNLYMPDIDKGISEITKYFKQGESSTTTTDIQYSYNNNIGINISNNIFSIVSDNPSNSEYWTTLYIPISAEKNYRVQISGSSSFRRLRYGFCTSLPAVGVSASSVQVLDGQSGFNYSFSNNSGYFFVTIDSRLLLTTRVFQEVTTTTTDNPLNIFDQQQKNHEDTIANNNQNTDKINNTLTSSEVSEDTYNIDTSFAGELNEDSYDNVLISMINSISSAITSRASTTIVIPIPYTDKNITLSSDLLSKYIQGTFIYSLIQTFWYFVFGVYFFRFGSRAIHWLTSGEIIEKGPSAFAEYLMKQNATITSEMM